MDDEQLTRRRPKERIVAILTNRDGSQVLAEERMPFDEFPLQFLEEPVGGDARAPTVRESQIIGHGGHGTLARDLGEFV